MKQDQKSLSKTIWVAKALLMLCVITAHVDFSGLNNQILNALIQRFASIGVPCYLLFSGFYYHPNKYKTLIAFFKQKKRLFIPWIFCGIIVSLYTFIRTNKKITFLKVLQFVLGYLSYFYFVTVLVFLMILFWFLRNQNKKILMIVCITISLVSVLLSACKLSDPVIAAIGITNYLNPLNWCGFFAIGYYMQDIDEFRIMQLVKKTYIPSVCIWLILFALAMFVENGVYGYFSFFGLIMELLAIPIVIQISWFLCNVSALVNLGKYSYSIYLWHMPIVPIVYKFIGNNAIGLFAVSILSYAVTFALIKFCLWIGKKTKLEEVTKAVLGIR